MPSSEDEPNWVAQSSVPEGSNFATKMSAPPLFAFGAPGESITPVVMPAT